MKETPSPKVTISKVRIRECIFAYCIPPNAKNKYHINLLFRFSNIVSNLLFRYSNIVSTCYFALQISYQLAISLFKYCNERGCRKDKIFGLKAGRL